LSAWELCFVSLDLFPTPRAPTTDFITLPERLVEPFTVHLFMIVAITAKDITDEANYRQIFEEKQCQSVEFNRKIIQRTRKTGTQKCIFFYSEK